MRLKGTPKRSIRSTILGPHSVISLHRRLVLQKVAAVDRVIEMQPLVVALLAGEVVDAVDAALAQTLCERLTGVRLSKSTSMPNSANFMAAARPASPPPTITTRCLANTMFSADLAVRR